VVLRLCERVGNALVAFLTKRRDGGEGGREVRSDCISNLNKRASDKVCGNERKY